MTTNYPDNEKYVKSIENCNKERMLEIDYILKASDAFYKDDMKLFKKKTTVKYLKNSLINEQKEILNSSGGFLNVENGRFVLLNNKVEIELTNS